MDLINVYLSNGRMAGKRIRPMAVLSSLSYSFCSVSMVMSNKALQAMYNHLGRLHVEVFHFSNSFCGWFRINLIQALAATYNAKLQFLLVVMQCIVATVIVELGRRCGWASYDRFNFATARRWLPVSLCFSSMLFTSFKALSIMNVPMVTVFKNLTNIVIVTGDWWFFHQSATPMVIASMAVMVFGAIVASYHDIEFDPWGYFWMVANCCATAGYVLYMKYATQTIKLPRFGMVFYNNLLTTCLLLPLAYVFGDFEKFINTPQLHTRTYTFINLFSGVVGVLLNFASLWCVATTSATTYAVVGSVNVIPTAIIGYEIFKSEITMQTRRFMFISMIGGFMYSYAKIMEKQKVQQSTGALTVSDAKGGESSGSVGSTKPLLADEAQQEDQTEHHKA